MKKLYPLIKFSIINLCLVVFSVFYHQANGQAIGSYTFTNTLPGGYAALSGATTVSVAIGNNTDEGISAPINMGFTFNFGGSNFTQIKMNTNGWATFNMTETSTTNYNSINSSSTFVVAGFSRDLVISNMKYMTTGTAPNRIFKMEYNGVRSFPVLGLNVVPTNGAFQVWLYESSNVVEIKYGAFTAGSFGTLNTTVTVGLKSFNTNIAHVRTVSGSTWSGAAVSNSSTATVSLTSVLFGTSQVPTNGRMFRFVPVIAACAGVPAPGNTVSTSNSTCGTEVFLLNLQNPPVTNVSCQWQVAPDVSGSPGTFVNTGIGGFTLTTTASSTSWYQCIVTCPGGGTTVSNPVRVINTPCYCIPALAGGCSAFDEFITNVTFGPLNNSSGCSSSGYTNYGNTIACAEVGEGATVPLSISHSAGFSDENIYVFIDYNNNGVLNDAGELVYQGSIPILTNTINTNIVIPNCVSGMKRMRVRMEYNANTDPCSPIGGGSSGGGEVEDYCIMINAVPVVPAVATNISGPASGTCGGTFTYSNAPGSSGAIQWQFATNAGGPYTNVAGANSSSQSFTVNNSGTYYLRVRYTGQGCTPVLFSNVLTVVVNPPTVNITASANNICRGTSVTLTATGPAPYLWNTGQTTQSITVTPPVTTTYSVTAGSTNCSASSTISVNVVGGPIAAATVNPATSVCPGTPHQLNANLINGQSIPATFNGGSITISGTLFGINLNTPYPSNLNVSGLIPTATVASVKLNNISHTYASDIDVVLVSPTGQAVMIMADAGGNVAFDSPKTLTFVDGAPQLTTGNFPSGTYSPTNLGSWSGPNPPAGPFASSLANFTGTMNGQWKLYVYDPDMADAGSIGAWSITFNNGFTTYTYDGAVTYSWSGTNGFSSNLPNPVDSPVANTTYTLTVADNSCSSASSATVSVLPQPSVSTSTLTPYCETNNIQFLTDGTVTGVSASLLLNINSAQLMDEVSWQLINSSNNVIASGGGYAAGSSNNITISPAASDYPVTFFIETQGDFNDNIANFTLTCSVGNTVLISGTLDEGLTFTSDPYSCVNVAPALSYSWSGPNGFSSIQEDPSIANATLANSGNYTVTIMDGNGCTNQFTSNVLVNPNPVATVTTTLVSCDGFNDGTAEINVNNNDQNGFYFITDDNGNFNFQNPAYFTGYYAGTYNYFIQDQNNCSASGPITIATVPNAAPSIVAPADLSVNSDAGVCGAVVNYSTPIGSDACPGATTIQTAGFAAGSVFPIGTTVNTFVVTDAGGLTATCSFNVTVTDNLAPEAICQPVTVQLDANGNGSITAAQIDNGSNDPCGIQSVTVSPTSFTCANVGTNNVVLTVTDNYGNVATCTGTVTVEDNIAPTAICQPVILQLDATGAASITAAQVNNGSSDNCAIQSMSVAPNTFSCSNLGANTVTLTVTDVNGNVSTCNATVTVQDNIAPLISCPGNISLNSTPGVCGAVATYAAPTTSDNCSFTVTQTNGLASGSVFPVGTTTNTFVVTDAAGNTATCSFNVTVTDNVAPVVTNCPASFAACNPITWTPPTFTDNCAGVQVVSSHTPGTIFPPGTTTITYTATDVYNNQTTCSFDVTVVTPSVAADTITSNRDYDNICLGENITLTIGGGTLGQGGQWNWYAGSCGGTSIGTGTTLTVTPSVTTTYYARAEGQCNTTACKSITVVVSSSSSFVNPVITSAPAYGAPGMTATVTCNTVPGATFYRWTSNFGQINGMLFNGQVGPVETTIPSVQVTFVLPQSNYQIRLVVGNACGRSNTASAQVRGTVSAPTSLSGPTLVCPLQTASYTVSAIPNAASYNWILIPANAGTISGSGLSRNITFAAAFTSAQLCVNGVSNFGLAGPSYCINISTSAPIPGLISGNSEPCEMSSENYSVTAVSGATSYIWTTNIPGAVINGTTTSAICDFPAGTFSGTICVQSVSACGVSAPSCLAVTSGTPGTPGPITGPVQGICNANGVNYSLATSNALSYSWSTPTGVTVASGGASNSVNLNFGAGFTTGTITVTATYSCGSASSSITVDGAPSAPSVTPTTICPGGDAVYFASSVGGSIYNWTISGADYDNCTNPPSCSQYYIYWSVNGGSFSVTSSNSCGTSAALSVSTNCRISSGTEPIDSKVYPNPTSGMLMVEFTSSASANFEIQVSDLTGRTVLAENVKATQGINQHEVNLTSFNKGIYMLTLKDENGNTKVTRVAVQ
jgi:subtilisin-like proprotein convertase family protein